MPAMPGVHKLSAKTFTELGRGFGGATAVEKLESGQFSKRKLLLNLIFESGIRNGHLPMETLDALAELEDTAFESFERVLMYPLVGEWLAATQSDQASESEFLYMGNVIAAIALRSEATNLADLDVAVVDGFVEFPSLGRLFLGAGAGSARFRQSRGGAFVVTDVGEHVIPKALDIDSDNWQALRTLSSTHDGLTANLLIDDVNTYRNRHNFVAAERLGATEIRRWRDLFERAWSMLVEHHRVFAEGIARGMQTITPIQSETDNVCMNATSMNAFGNVNMTWPVDEVNFAVGLVHEFQHGKLGAFIDLSPLTVSNDQRFYAPWRADPRPIGGLIQGTYAYLGVVEFWRRQRLIGDRSEQTAHVEYARWRRQVDRAIDVLRASGQLTERGEQFVAHMRASLDDSNSDAVPELLNSTGRLLSDDHELLWKLRNVEPAADRIGEIASAFLEGSPIKGEVPTTVLTSERTHYASSRERSLVEKLATVGLSGGDGFEPQCSTAEQGTKGRSAVDSPADAALFAGELSDAIKLYEDRIVEDLDDIDAWSGLALADARRGNGSVWLAKRPETVRGVYKQIATVDVSPRSHPRPMELARWLDKSGLSAG